MGALQQIHVAGSDLRISHFVNGALGTGFAMKSAFGLFLVAESAI
jgi:hypothetical protein